MTGLNELKLGWCDLDNADIAKIAEGLVNLESLDLKGSGNLNPSGMTPLQNLKKLKHLDISWNKVDERICEDLANLKQIEELYLTYCTQLTDGGLAHLKKLPKLAILNLKGCEKITNTGLSHIAECKQLVSLDLTDCLHISILSPLQFLQKLTTLKLRGCRPALGEFKHLHSMPQLTTLDLSDCPQITYKGLDLLPWKGKLTHLIKPAHLYYAQTIERK